MSDDELANFLLAINDLRASAINKVMASLDAAEKIDCVHGCALEQARIIADGIWLDSDKRCRIVSDWVWIEMDVSDQRRAEYQDQGVLPSLIFSKKVVWDSSGEYTGRVRTSLLSKFSENCIFETRNTFYILVGRGTKVIDDGTLVRDLMSFI